MDLSVDPSVVDQANDILEEIKNEGAVMVQAAWPAIKRVVAALMASDLLTEADIDRLMIGAQGS